MLTLILPKQNKYYKFRTTKVNVKANAQGLIFIMKIKHEIRSQGHLTLV